MSQTKSYVRIDEHGVYRVGGTRVMLDSVLAAFRQGDSPETIQQQYPALTLEEVYGSIAYCLANASEIDAYVKRQDAEWAKARARADNSAWLETMAVTGCAICALPRFGPNAPQRSGK